MSKLPHRFPDDEPGGRMPWEKGCYVLLAGIGVVMLAAWLRDIFEVMSGLMLGVFFLWQVIRGLVIRRYFWYIAEEKVSFWGLLGGFVICLAFYWLCRENPSAGSFPRG